MNETILTMKERPRDQQPYEKCIAYGPAVLSDAELLAIILRSGCRGCSSVELASRVLCLCKYEQGLSGILHLSKAQLEELSGIGKVKAIQILALGELAKRISRGSARKSLAFSDPSSIADYYMEFLCHEETEQVVCMMLDTKNHLLGEHILSKGTVNQSLISPRELFLAILSYHAVHFVLVHNHPSGDPEPSREDLIITKRLDQCGKMLGIVMHDHIIIGNHCYVSLRGQGFLQ